MPGGANAAFLGYVDRRGRPWLFVVALKDIAAGEVSMLKAFFTSSVTFYSWMSGDGGCRWPWLLVVPLKDIAAGEVRSGKRTLACSLSCLGGSEARC
jgi:hypothetical protein